MIPQTGWGTVSSQGAMVCVCVGVWCVRAHVYVSVHVPLVSMAYLLCYKV